MDTENPYVISPIMAEDGGSTLYHLFELVSDLWAATFVVTVGHGALSYRADSRLLGIGFLTSRVVAALHV